MAALTALAGCTKSRQTTAPSTLVGNWRWVMQVNDGMSTGTYTGPPLGDTLTPQSTGIQRTLTFNPDWSYAVVDNGQRVESGMYRFDTLIAPGPMNGPNIILFLAFVRPGLPDSVVNHGLSGDTLVTMTAEITSVGVASIYVRANGGD